MILVPKNAQTPAGTEWYVGTERVENIKTRKVSFDEDGNYHFVVHVKYKKGEELEANNKDKGQVQAGLGRKPKSSGAGTGDGESKVPDSGAEGALQGDAG